MIEKSRSQQPIIARPRSASVGDTPSAIQVRKPGENIKQWRNQILTLEQKMVAKQGRIDYLEQYIPDLNRRIFRLEKEKQDLFQKSQTLEQEKCAEVRACVIGDKALQDQREVYIKKLEDITVKLHVNLLELEAESKSEIKRLENENSSLIHARGLSNIKKYDLTICNEGLENHIKSQDEEAKALKHRIKELEDENKKLKEPVETSSKPPKKNVQQKLMRMFSGHHSSKH